MKKYVTATLLPPLGACRYGCGNHCAAPVTVFWLFGLISIVIGLFGGPTGGNGVSWATIGLGLGMWAIASTWTLLSLQGVEANRCHGSRKPRDHQVAAGVDATDPLEEVEQAR